MKNSDEKKQAAILQRASSFRDPQFEVVLLSRDTGL